MQESIIKTCESAVGALGLKGLGGEDGDVDVKEDVKELSKGYNYKKANVDIEFTATFKGTYDSTKRKVDDNNDDDGIIDVETVTEEDVEKEASDAVCLLARDKESIKKKLDTAEEEVLELSYIFQEVRSASGRCEPPAGRTA